MPSPGLVIDDPVVCATQAGLDLDTGSGTLPFAAGVDARITPVARAIGEARAAARVTDPSAAVTRG
jgi:hypothetical protein